MLELVGGALLVFGLFTRPVALPLTGLVVVACWVADAPRSIYPVGTGGATAIAFCYAFLYRFIAGPGPASLDALR